MKGFIVNSADNKAEPFKDEKFIYNRIQKFLTEKGYKATPKKDAVFFTNESLSKDEVMLDLISLASNLQMRGNFSYLKTSFKHLSTGNKLVVFPRRITLIIHELIRN